MIRWVVAGLLAAVLALPAAASTSPDPLIRAVRARDVAAYRGEQIVATWDGASTQVTLARVEHDPPDWSRLDYTPIGSSRRWIILRQGTTEIQYDATTRQGTRTTRLVGDDDTFLSSHLPWLLANYRITVSPGTLLGRHVERVEIRPVLSDRPRRNVDVDAQTGVVLRSERIGPDGRPGEFTAFVSFEVMPRGWRKDVAPPSNLRLTQLVRARAVTRETAARALGRSPLEVTLPSGFHRVALYLTEDREAVLQTVYSDGLSVLVVSQQPGTIARPPQGSRIVSTSSGPVWVHEMGLRTLVHWSHAGWLLTAVGDVTAQSLVGLAEHTGVASAPRIWERLLVWLRDLGLSF